MLVGEIGYNRKEFLYELKFWEIRAIIRGYRNREHTAWEASRLNAFFIMSSMSDLRKGGIFRDTDLIKFPWENERAEPGNQPTKKEVEELRELMRRENAAREQAAQKEEKGD